MHRLLDILSAMLVPLVPFYERIDDRETVLAKVVLEYPMIYDLWDIFILGKPRYSPHRTGIVYAPHRSGSGIVWVLDNDTLDTYSKKSWH